MINKDYCLAIYIVLYAATILAIFVRGLIRRKLILYAEKNGFPGIDSRGKSTIQRLFLAIPGRALALRQLAARRNGLPESVGLQILRFRQWSWITFSCLGLLILFALIAHRICGG